MHIPDGFIAPQVYVPAYAAAAGLTLTIVVLAIPRQRVLGREVLATSFWRTALTGASIFFTYSLVLLAMHLARDVSYVVAFRQLSVPIGAALGVIVLKEPLHKPKIIGIAVVTVGLLLVGLG